MSVDVDVWDGNPLAMIGQSQKASNSTTILKKLGFAVLGIVLK